jgi:hypothetical protein
MKKLFSILEIILLIIGSALITVLICAFFFGVVHLVVYRLIVVFLVLIFISNLMAKLAIVYFKNKK